MANTYKPIGSHVEVSDMDPAVEVTVPARANAIMMAAITANVLYRLDGVAPDVDTGFQLVAGAEPTIIPVRSGRTISFFESGATAVLQYQFLRLDNR